MRSLLLAALCLSATLAAGEDTAAPIAVRQVQTQALVLPDDRTPEFRHGYLFAYHLGRGPSSGFARPMRRMATQPTIRSSRWPVVVRILLQSATSISMRTATPLSLRRRSATVDACCTASRSSTGGWAPDAVHRHRPLCCDAPFHRLLTGLRSGPWGGHSWLHGA